MTDSPLIWFAAAAVLVGCGLVLLSLSMNAAKRARPVDEADGLFADGDPGVRALFIDEPLVTDMATELAGKTAVREAGKSLKEEEPWEGARGPDDVAAESGRPSESLLEAENSSAHAADGSGDPADDDDTLETEAPLIGGATLVGDTRPRKRAVSHSARKMGGKSERGKRPRSRPGLFPRGR